MNYDSYARDANVDHLASCSEETSLSEYLNAECQVHLALIRFFKQMRLFEELTGEEKGCLIQENLQRSILFHSLLLSHFTEDARLSPLFSRWISPEFHQQMSLTGQRLQRFLSHPWLVQVFLLVLIFSLSLYPRQRSSTLRIDRLKIFADQNHFVRLLWKSLHHLFDERESIRLFDLLISRVLRYQSLMTEFDLLVSREICHLNPLISSILSLE